MFFCVLVFHHTLMISFPFCTLKVLEMGKLLIEVLGKFVPLSIGNIKMLTQLSLNYSMV